MIALWAFIITSIGFGVMVATALLVDDDKKKKEEKENEQHSA